MGYLQIAAAPLTDFKKAVISLWFRIPDATLSAVSALSNTPPDGSETDTTCGLCYYPALYKVIPLITFGAQEVDSNGNAASPSFVGIDCSNNPPTLAVNLQTSGSMSGTLAHPPSTTRPGCYYMSGRAEAFASAADCTITADVWHHALISFDISGGCSASYPDLDPPNPWHFSVASASTFSWALNDVSKVNGSIQPSGGGRWADNGMSAPTSIIAQGLVNYPEAGDGSVAYGAGTIRSGSVGIPAAATFVDNVYNIEMAELQLYTGVTLDASVEENRRAFIRSDRRPVKHVMVDGILMPAAALLLGKMPEIWMHGSQNWIAGKNTGTLGNFAPSGTRNPYPGPGD